MVPEIDPKSFGSFEKRAPGPVGWPDEGSTLPPPSSAPSMHEAIFVSQSLIFALFRYFRGWFVRRMLAKSREKVT